MKHWNVLKTEAAYVKAVKRTIEIFHAKPGTPEDKELDLLLVLVKDYEDKHIVIPEVPVVEVIKIKMEEQGLKYKDLAKVIGSKGHISAVLSGKRELTLKMAKKLRDYFDLPAELFLQM